MQVRFLFKNPEENIDWGLTFKADGSSFKVFGFLFSSFLCVYGLAKAIQDSSSGFSLERLGKKWS